MQAPLPSGGDATIEKLLVRFILQQINLERQGDLIDRKLIKSCIRMMQEYSIPNEAGEQTPASLIDIEFGPSFLETSQEFYKMEAVAWRRESTAVLCGKHEKARISEERARCRSILPNSSTLHIISIIEETFARN
jgi:cullin 3